MSGYIIEKKPVSKAKLNELLKESLQLHLPYHAPGNINAKGVPASVFIQIAQDAGDRFHMLFTQRTPHVETHKGQIAFPGGMTDPEDYDCELDSAIITALRENEEEVGVSRNVVEVLGALPAFTIPVSGFQVTPVVGTWREKLEKIPIRPNRNEIDEVFWAHISQLMESQSYRLEEFEFNGRMVKTHVYHIGKHRIWGATALMVHNLIERLKRLGFDGNFF